TTGNTLTPAAATDVNGVTTGTLSSTKAETKVVAATVDGVAITQQPTVAVGPAVASNVTFVVQPPASTTAGATLTPAVQVEIRDQFNNRVTNATNGVTLAIGTNPSGATLTGGTPAVAAVNGVATFGGLSIDKAGTGYTLVASSTGLSSQTSSALNITAGAATTIAINGGDAQTDTIGATLPTPYSVKVTDANNHPIGGVTVTWGVTGGGSINPSSVTGATGLATATRVLGTIAGAQGATATVTGLAGSAVTFTATATHGGARTIALSGGNSQADTIGATLPVPYAVLVTDRAGNPVGGITVTWAVTGGGSITSSSVTGATGIASATRVLGPTAGPQGATATVTGLTGSPVPFAATATAGGATKLVITTEPSTPAASGVAFSTQPVVQLRDANNNNVAQAGTVIAASVVVGPAGATLANATATTTGGGAATFSGLAISGPVGSYRLQVAVGTLTPDTTIVIALGPGPAAKLALTTQPSGSAQNAIAFAQQPVVQLQDAAGNNVSQVNVAVTPAIASGGGTLAPVTAVLTSASGAAAFSGLTITGTVGPRTLSFTSGTLTGITSNPVTVTAGTATQIAVNGGNNQAAPAGTAVTIPPSVLVRDVSGNLVSGAAVTFAAPGTTNGVLTGPSQSTNTSGVATVGSWTLSTTPKPDTVTATSTGLAGSPVTFVDTAKVGAATHIAKFSGDVVGP